MSLLDELRKKLDSETFTKVTDQLGDDFNYDLVSRGRLNRAIKQRNDVRAELEELKQSGIDPDQDPDDPDDSDDGGAEPPKGGKAKQQKSTPKGGLTQKDLDAAVAAERAEGEKKMKELQLRYAITAKLQAEKFTDPELVLNAGLIDLSKIEVDDKGAITKGLDDQIKAVATSKPYLVGKASGGASTGTGKDGSTDFSTITTREEFMKLNTTQQLEFKQANPDVFQSFMAQI